VTCENCQTVCIWEKGGCHHPGDDELRLEVAQALGAAPDAVETIRTEVVAEGAWLTYRIWAPNVPKDWTER
jgi:hypothetical protein